MNIKARLQFIIFFIRLSPSATLFTELEFLKRSTTALFHSVRNIGWSAIEIKTEIFNLTHLCELNAMHCCDACRWFLRPFTWTWTTWYSTFIVFSKRVVEFSKLEIYDNRSSSHETHIDAKFLQCDARSLFRCAIPFLDHFTNGAAVFYNNMIPMKEKTFGCPCGIVLHLITNAKNCFSMFQLNWQRKPRYLHSWR